MKTASFIFMFLVLLCACSQKQEQTCQISTVTLKISDKLHTEYYFTKEGSCSSVGWGVEKRNEVIRIYSCCSKRESTFYIDNGKQIQLLDSVISRININHTNVNIASINLTLSHLGISGIEMSNNYQNTIWYNKDMGIWLSKKSNSDFSWVTRHHLYKSLSELFVKHGYISGTIVKSNDAYPYETKDMVFRNLLPSSVTDPSVIWDVPFSIEVFRQQ